MTVHAIQIVTATSQASNSNNVPSPAPPDFVASLLEDRMQQNALNSLSEVIPEQASPVTKVTPVDGGTEHFRGGRRFSETDDKPTVLDEIENNVVADAEWYEVRHHVCDHDADNPSGCDSWTVERSSGTVPDDV